MTKSEVNMLFSSAFREDKAFYHIQSHKVFRKSSNSSYLVTA